MKKIYNSERVIKQFLTRKEIRYAQYYNYKMPKSTYGSKTECYAACKQASKRIKGYITEKKNFYFFIEGEYHSAETLDEWITLLSKYNRYHLRLERERKAINQMCIDAGLSSYTQAITSTYRTGEHIGSYNAIYSDRNKISVDESYDKYSNQCSFKMVIRSFTLHLRKPWKICKTGGLLTFYRGKFNRKGIACEWIKQGKAINDFRTMKGYLVRGEHIEAKSLKAAIDINNEHRAGQLARLLRQRKKQERK